ncbi:prostaglandin E2 receptor EP2 subtype-like isoform X1 [Branchiostoma floridae x Branchiostoma japonicum]
MAAGEVGSWLENMTDSDLRETSTLFNGSTNVSDFTTPPLSVAEASGLPYWLVVVAFITLGMSVTIGFVGNVFVLVVIHYILARRRSWPTVLLRYLAWTDVLNCSIGLIPPVAAYFHDVFANRHMCNFTGTLLYGLSCASQLLVALMSIERCISIILPFLYEKHFGPDSKIPTVTVFILLLYATVVSLLPVFGLNENVIHYPYSWCMFNFRDKTVTGSFVVYLNFVVMSLTMVVVVLCNTVVASHIWCGWRRRSFRCSRRVNPVEDPEQEYVSEMHRNRSLTPPTIQNDGPSTVSSVVDTKEGRRGRRREKSQDKERQLNLRFTELTVGVAVGFTFCWLFFTIRILTNQLGVWMDDNIDFIAARLMTFNSVINPLLYIAICKPYRKGCWVILRNIVHYVTCTSVKKLDMTLAEAVA